MTGKPVHQRIVDAYITSLRQHLPTRCLRKMDVLRGATEEQQLRLQSAYPAAPAELLYLLQRMNGTSWRGVVDAAGSGPLPSPSPTPSTGTKTFLDKLGGGKANAKNQMPWQRRFAVPVMGSVLANSPFYLSSVEEMLAPRLPEPFSCGSSPAPAAAGPSTSVEERSVVELYANGFTVRELCRGKHAVFGEDGRCIKAAAESANKPTTPPPMLQRLRESISSPKQLPNQADDRLVGVDSARIDAAAVAPDASTAASEEANLLVLDSRIQPALSLRKRLLVATSVPPRWMMYGGNEASKSDADAASQPSPRSWLYVDFHPVEGEGGVVGQVIEHRHDPRTCTAHVEVVADSFKSYLKTIMADEYDFTEELDDDENDSAENAKVATISTDAASQSVPVQGGR